MSTRSGVRTSYTCNVNGVVRFHVLWHCQERSTGGVERISLTVKVCIIDSRTQGGHLYRSSALTPQKTKIRAVACGSTPAPHTPENVIYDYWTERVNATMWTFLPGLFGCNNIISPACKSHNETPPIADCICSKRLAEKVKISYIFFFFFQKL